MWKTCYYWLALIVMGGHALTMPKKCVRLLRNHFRQNHHLLRWLKLRRNERISISNMQWIQLKRNEIVSMIRQWKMKGYKWTWSLIILTRICRSHAFPLLKRTTREPVTLTGFLSKSDLWMFMITFSRFAAFGRQLPKDASSRFL